MAFPDTGILPATINREKEMNSLPVKGHPEGARLWQWMDDEPCPRVGIQEMIRNPYLLDGVMGLSLRRGKNPVIAAVNGIAMGGGFEAVLNCDLVVSSPEAEFSLPEVQRGLYAGGGGLAAIVWTCGMQIGSELALTGRRASAEERKRLGWINVIAMSPKTVVPEAIEMARMIASYSPDAVIATHLGLRELSERNGIRNLTERTTQQYGRR
ncbi:enoyl-CoA hydratase/isomerase family protein [Aspergillus homomorphus CBS 101889]|uniref:ClpP/crotonase n=1 Tax=Aspergillus homomorphus (strain CBS 101889) TaxID=1450537 RepID=A0A395HMX9_ASPHC|nr:ClpP/crotonase [Aspergillus homomorphus CBS 101889]RAL08839.1 ClpP/crotonase [Aspergillus homomorphus CBS 101889]